MPGTTEAVLWLWGNIHEGERPTSEAKEEKHRQKEAWVWGSSLSAELALTYYFPDFFVRPWNAFHFKTTVIKVLLFAAESILIQQFILLL